MPQEFDTERLELVAPLPVAGKPQQQVDTWLDGLELSFLSELQRRARILLCRQQAV